MSPEDLVSRLVSMRFSDEFTGKVTVYDGMLELIPTFRYDAQLVVETKDKWDRFKGIEADVLLMGGGQSPAFLPIALTELEKVIPHVPRVYFPKLNHGGSGNRNRGGNPQGGWGGTSKILSS